MEDLHISPWSLEHLDSLVLNANNINIARMLRNRFPHPYTKKDGQDYIKLKMACNPAEDFAIIADNRAIGSIGLMLKDDIHCKNAEIGYWIGEVYWGKGIITSLVPRVVEYGFKTFDINRIYAVVSDRNIGSCKVLEKCGFQLEARFEKTLFKRGEYHDELIYAIRKDPEKQ